MSTKKITLNNARLVWKSPKEANGIDGVVRQTFCFKLPANVTGVQEVNSGSEALYVITEFERADNRFLLAGGGRGDFQRKFYAGEQVGSFLTLKDVANPPISFSVVVRLPDEA